jgi:hypothetical protein
LMVDRFNNPQAPPSFAPFDGFPAQCNLGWRFIWTSVHHPEFRS